MNRLARLLAALLWFCAPAAPLAVWLAPAAAVAEDECGDDTGDDVDPPAEGDEESGDEEK